MIHRLAGRSKMACGSPPFWLSHGVPVWNWPKNVLNVNAFSWLPLLSYTPIDVLTVCTKFFGPTAPDVSGGCPAPQVL